MLRNKENQQLSSDLSFNLKIRLNFKLGLQNISTKTVFLSQKNELVTFSNKTYKHQSTKYFPKLCISSTAIKFLKKL